MFDVGFLDVVVDWLIGVCYCVSWVAGLFTFMLSSVSWFYCFFAFDSLYIITLLYWVGGW